MLNGNEAVLEEFERCDGVSQRCVPIGVATDLPAAVARTNAHAG